jgi:hypothetical protein
MSGILARLLVVGGIVAVASPTLAHDSWISRGALRNGAGEWCCGDGDCSVVPSDQVKSSPAGYNLFNAETVPYSEALPSLDGAYWRCKRPDGSRRCFFAPTPTD